MTKKLAPSVCVGGIVLASIGFWWLWTGLDIVQVERGWSAVIAGATMMSAGFVIMALSAVLWTMQQIVDLLRTQAQAHHGEGHTGANTPVGAEGQIGAEHKIGAEDRVGANDEVRHAPLTPASGSMSFDTSAASRSIADQEVVGRHVSGDTTYVMFADGSVDAQTPDGLRHFTSLEALRVYADEREAAVR